ncbi:MAG: lipoate--protein ligase family protein [Pseudomonadota bacterium]|uniref:lipoyl protein ligase domain-containing protein n=1 Tax=Tritonibacter mobilis TaxID=379347 RepID=UPI0001B8AD48|nr:lipoate--protein ligase family protein [Tritonibacter mobilis]EEW60344.1 biotin/lipoate A/B protein ligase [Ruegeria sp. TrichCH4B]MCZ4268793.1 lipoate--protein ligase family protein [Rhodobacteraceae bacterium G21628-S1]MEE2811121.1 lipoate--protein ligase family protein [Pseudomonadota bacterium]NKX74721.1 lipoate--protein ligase family protein [Rhodobacteraceae bacterium R_SAG3]
MHGEYKVPGGKLVVADVNVAEGTITDVQISGDFFLEPEEALGPLCDALSGQSTSASVQELSQAIKAALPEDVLLFGFSPEAVAIAVRRALGVAKTWQDFEWQIVHSKPVTPLMHVALDEVLAHEVAKGRRAPTLRFWEWDRAAVILGSFQSVKNEVDMDAAGKLGVEVVRRSTGGGAMFVEKGTAITYSLYAPVELVADMDFADSYAFLDNWVLKALNTLGIEAYYKPLNDITSPKGKIGGAAQRRFANKTVLHHVTMAYDMDAEKMMQVLRIGREKLSDKGTASAAKRVDPVRSQTGMERSDVIESMKATFTDLNGATVGDITDDEYRAAEELVATKYGTEAWLNKLP